MADQHKNPEANEIEGTADPQTTELIAYLDGELPEQDAERVEQLLLTNSLLRRNAESFDRTWQLLNSLEEPRASGQFTQKTLASISAVAAESDADRARDQRWSVKRHLPWSLIARGLIWCLAGFFACATGLLLSRMARSERTALTDAQILKDLDLYLQYPKLWRIPDVEFLKEVSDNAKPSPVAQETR
ncbi:MAG: hypothetical protein DWI22_10420 [Planctomycetota bacterium]|nr:hypothetical protein [Planctomycetales bacterium]RLT07225.1 MAG: hypothetical protein DWI22_10420 [Planctomycetota bacterium]